MRKLGSSLLKPELRHEALLATLVLIGRHSLCLQSRPLILVSAAGADAPRERGGLCQGSAIQIHLGSAKRIQVKSLTEKRILAQLA
jgi:hypothetical protein